MRSYNVMSNNTNQQNATQPVTNTAPAPASSTGIQRNLNDIVDGYDNWKNHLEKDVDVTASQFCYSSESYYKAFWEDAMHAIAIVNEQGIIVEANGAFCNLIGINQSRVAGISIRNLVADGEFREDLRMIDTMVLGNMIDGVTDERWNYKLQGHGPYIPVRLKAMRIPAYRGTKFTHIIIQVYDLRSTRYDMQGKNWSNKKWGELAKELLMEHFGKIASLILILLILLGLNGQLGHVVDKLIDTYAPEPTPQYHQVEPRQQDPPVNSSEKHEEQ